MQVPLFRLPFLIGSLTFLSILPAAAQAAPALKAQVQCDGGVCKTELRSLPVSLWEEPYYTEYSPEMAASLAAQLLSRSEITRVEFETALYTRNLIDSDERLFEVAARYCRNVSDRQEEISRVAGSAVTAFCATLEDPSYRIYFPGEPKRLKRNIVGKGGARALFTSIVAGAISFPENTFYLLLTPLFLLITCPDDCFIPYEDMARKVSEAYEYGRGEPLTRVGTVNIHFSE